MREKSQNAGPIRREPSCYWSLGVSRRFRAGGVVLRCRIKQDKQDENIDVQHGF